MTIDPSPDNATDAPKSSFAAASDAHVSFAAGIAGSLRLDNSTGFTGSISGLDGDDAIDLADLVGRQRSVAYADNGDGTGRLTVADGVTSIDLQLLGQYAAAGFSAGSDAGGGTVVTYDPMLDPNHQNLAMPVG